jgi:hypothetical protein
MRFCYTHGSAVTSLPLIVVVPHIEYIRRLVVKVVLLQYERKVAVKFCDFALISYIDPSGEKTELWILRQILDP